MKEYFSQEASVPIQWEAFKQLDGTGTIIREEPVTIYGFYSGKYSLNADDVLQTRSSNEVIIIFKEEGITLDTRDAFTFHGKKREAEGIVPYLNEYGKVTFFEVVLK